MKSWERVEQIHMATLDALSKTLPANRPVVLQGGASLHLAHGSPRYSEDIDFLVAAPPEGGVSGRSWLEEVMRRVAQSVSAATLRQVGQPTRLHAPAANQRGRNPAVFELRVPSANRSDRSTVVKCEFFEVPADLLARYGATARPLRSSFLPTVTPIVEVADTIEIVIDKVHAVAARPYLKYRDVFDLWWLRETVAPPTPGWVAEALSVHAAMYGEGNASDVLSKATQRLATVNGAAMRAELDRFVPSGWMTDGNRARMVEACQAWIDDLQNPIIASASRGPSAR